MFFGVYNCAIDLKMRIVIPLALRRKLPEKIFLMNFGDHLRMMNYEEFAEISNILDQHNDSNLKRIILNSVEEISIVNGRMHIPHLLAAKAYFFDGNEVVLVGANSYIEIYNAERYRNKLFDSELSDILFLDKEHALPAARYGEGVVKNTNILLPKKDIIIPSQEIIESLEAVNHSLLTKIKENENLITELTSREFEELVFEILEKNDINAKLTKQTHDGGKDIVVCENKLIGNFLIYVECKKYSKKNPVAVNLVRELYGVVMADNATAGLLVTTSYFTKEAKEYTETIKNRMSLMDYNGLLNAISKTNI